MSDNIFEARLGIIDTLRGVLLDLADIDDIPEQDRPDMVEQMGEVAEMMLEVLNLQVTAVDGSTVTATLTLEEPDDAA